VQTAPLGSGADIAQRGTVTLAFGSFTIAQRALLEQSFGRVRIPQAALFYAIDPTLHRTKKYLNFDEYPLSNTVNALDGTTTIEIMNRQALRDAAREQLRIEVAAANLATTTRINGLRAIQATAQFLSYAGYATMVISDALAQDGGARVVAANALGAGDTFGLRDTDNTLASFKARQQENDL
jgi:hypothetical protein